MQLLTVKNLMIFFGLASVGLLVSTIVLAVQKGELQDELDAALDKIENGVTTTSTAATGTGSTDSTASTAATGSTDSTTKSTTDGTPPGPTDTTASTASTSPTIPTPPVETTTPSTTPSTTQNPEFPNPNEIIYRLPNHIRPNKYQLYLNPNLKTQTYEGTVSIGIGVDKPTNVVALHSQDLDIFGVSILPVMAMMRIKVKTYYTDPVRQLLIIELEEVLDMYSPYTVSVSFRGKLNRLSGLYASSYTDKDGNQRWIATSKFEPTYARQAFPCFDEPAMKTYFEVTIVRPTDGGYRAFSNMNQVSQMVKGNETEVTFADSVYMSTYLACFIVADFKDKQVTIEPSIGNPFNLRVLATEEQIEKTTYALSVGAAIIKSYITYFKLAYPLPKLDMAAIPDFVSGAMEHWGLVTYRETALLYDENTSSSVNKQRVATVIAHELAHMWFGNLVTMKWWNDLWLNEGFASYIEYKGVDSVHPEWKMLDQFPISEVQPVFKLDATLASHPIVQTVESPAQITELFDSITYSKGASIIRMLEGFVGEEDFQETVYNYLYKYQFTNAETDDFLSEFDALEKDFDCKLIMKTWTVQMGFPVVEVSRVSPTQLKLTQKRFLSNPDDYEKTFTDSEFNYRWTIPITYITSANPVTQKTWFNYNDAELTLDLPSAITWIKINKDQVGYYRVNYDEDIWREIISTLVNTPSAFSISDRAHLLNDAFSLADATQLSYDIALDLTKFLSTESEYVPWSVAASKLLSIRNLLYYTDAYTNFRSYASNLLKTVYLSVGWEVDPNAHLTNLLRVTVLDAACSLGLTDCLSEVGTRFTAWLSNPDERPKPDLRDIIYYYGMSSAGNEENWQQMWDIFKAENDASEKLKLMKGLSGIKEPWMLQRFIELAWDESNVRSQDYFTCLQYISNNPVGQGLVWDYVRENWERLVERFGINERYLGRMIPSITRKFITSQKLEEMEVFFQKYPEAGAGTAARKEALENVKNNINWVKANKAKIATWLANN